MHEESSSQFKVEIVNNLQYYASGCTPYFIFIFSDMLLRHRRRISFSIFQRFLEDNEVNTELQNKGQRIPFYSKLRTISFCRVENIFSRIYVYLSLYLTVKLKFELSEIIVRSFVCDFDLKMQFLFSFFYFHTWPGFVVWKVGKPS